MRKTMTIFVPEFVPLQNKGEEAIIRGYEAMFSHVRPGIEFQWGILGDVEQPTDHGNIRVFPRRWVENAMWPERAYKYKRMIWDLLYCFGIKGRIRNVHARQGIYAPLASFWDTMDLMIVGHDGYFKTACGMFLEEARKSNVPGGILGCGFYPAKRGHWQERIQRRTFKRTMEICNFSVFREKTPFKYMAEIGGAAHGHKAKLLPDPAFVMEPDPSADVVEVLRKQPWYRLVKEESTAFVGVTVCQNDTHVIPFSAGHNWGGSLDSYWQYLAELLDAFVEETGCRLLFLPHCIRPGKNDDLANARELIKRMKEAERCHIMEGDYSARFMKGVIKELDFLIGQRTHSLIGSVGVLTPSVGLTSSTDGRTHEILGGFCEYGDFLIDIDAMSPAQARTVLLDGFRGRHLIKKKQQRCYQAICANLYGIADQIFVDLK